MKSNVQIPFARDFRAQFMSLDVDAAALARTCWNATGDSIFVKDVRSRRGAALCFAVQQLSELGLSSSNQEEMAKQLLKPLENL
jgi:hypothetical protein